MRTHLPFLRAAVGIVALLCTTMAPSSTEAQSQSQESREQRIEIVIEDRAFFLAKGGLLQVGTPLEIVVENRDNVRHGFTSPMLIGLLVLSLILTFSGSFRGRRRPRLFIRAYSSVATLATQSSWLLLLSGIVLLMVHLVAGRIGRVF